MGESIGFVKLENDATILMIDFDGTIGFANIGNCLALFEVKEKQEVGAMTKANIESLPKYVSTGDVLLKFNNPKSIDVLIDVLEKSKEIIFGNV